MSIAIASQTITQYNPDPTPSDSLWALWLGAFFFCGPVVSWKCFRILWLRTSSPINIKKLVAITNNISMNYIKYKLYKSLYAQCQHVSKMFKGETTTEKPRRSPFHCGASRIVLTSLTKNKEVLHPYTPHGAGICAYIGVIVGYFWGTCWYNNKTYATHGAFGNVKLLYFWLSNSCHIQETISNSIHHSITLIQHISTKALLILKIFKHIKIEATNSTMRINSWASRPSNHEGLV
jgi:hypothetical protein